MGRRRRSRWPLGSRQLAGAGGHAKDFLKIFARAVVGYLGWVGGCAHAVHAVMHAVMVHSAADKR